jgi:hypothetical protein
MQQGLKDEFTGLWGEYFPGAELPMCFYYADEPGGAEPVTPPAGHRCLIADLARVRKGRSISFDADGISCFGGKRYLGFPTELMPNFEYFLSHGIPGELEGERYKKSPELVKEFVQHAPPFEAPAPCIIFKRWDALDEPDEPAVVVFFAQADVLSGLFTLANFDEAEPDAVFCPFAAGCGSIVRYPYLEGAAARPRAVLGMFDVSARPCVPHDTLSFAVPMSKFERMVVNMRESFLITRSWDKVKRRIEQL